MKATALYSVSIDWVNYKKWETYEIKKQVNIAWKNYFQILKQDEVKEDNKKNTKSTKNEIVEKPKPEVVEKPNKDEVKEDIEKLKSEVVEWENFENLAK